MSHEDMLAAVAAQFQAAQEQIKNWQAETLRLEGEHRLLQRLIAAAEAPDETPSSDSAGVPATE